MGEPFGRARPAKKITMELPSQRSGRGLSVWRRWHPGWIPFFICIGLRLFSLSHLVGSPYFPPGDGDTRFYLDWATRISNGAWTDGQSFYGLPGYPYLLALFLRITGQNLVFPIVVQATADAGIAFLITDFAILIFAGQRESNRKSDSCSPSAAIAGVGAGAGWCLYQPAQAYSLAFMPTTFGILAYWILVRAVMGLRSVPGPLSAVWGGIALGLAATMVANILILTPLIAIQLWRLGRQDATPWRAVVAGLVVAGGIVIGTAPCWMHNYFVAREPVLFSSHGGINLYIGNQMGATGYPKMPPGIRASQSGMQEDSRRFAEQTENRKLTRAEAGEFWAGQGRWAIRHDPARWIGLLGTKLRNYWNAFQYDDISIIRGLRDEGVTVDGPGFALVAAFGLPGLLVASRFRPTARWLVAAIALHMLSILPVFVTERYRSAAVPGLMVGAAVGLFWCWEHLAQAHWRTVMGWYLLPLGVAIWFVTLPVRETSLWGLDLYNSAKTLLDAGRIDEAGGKVKQALAYSPANAETNFLMGNYWLAKGAVQQAKNSYRATLDLDPGHAGAWNNLGVMALDEQRWELAERFLAHAVTLRPNDAKSFYLLARARQGEEKFPSALEAINTAIALRTGEADFVRLQRQIQAQIDSPSRALPKDE